MCIVCEKIGRLAAAGEVDLEVVQREVDRGHIELYAANCRPDEMRNYLELGKYYTINSHYFCPKCGKYYYIGFCLYGSPIIKEEEAVDALCGANRLEWGRTGTFFEGNRRLMDNMKSVFVESYIDYSVLDYMISVTKCGASEEYAVLVDTLRKIKSKLDNGEIFHFYYPNRVQLHELNRYNFDQLCFKFFGRKLV